MKPASPWPRGLGSMWLVLPRPRAHSRRSTRRSSRRRPRRREGRPWCRGAASRGVVAWSDRDTDEVGEMGFVVIQLPPQRRAHRRGGRVRTAGPPLWAMLTGFGIVCRCFVCWCCRCACGVNGQDTYKIHDTSGLTDDTAYSVTAPFSPPLSRLLEPPF